MRKPEFITFTGADDATSIKGMVELAQLYPIEWGVLFSTSQTGKGTRYPKLDTVAHMVGEGLRLSAHLCGKHSRDLLRGADADLDDLQVDCLIRHQDFARIQVNTAEHFIPFGPLARWAESKGSRLILQCRDSYRFPDDNRLDWLFDKSGGRGESPDRWPASHPDRALVGYAGGINPENVREVIAEIGETGPYWIDMESGVRTENRFDLAKCRAVCEAVYG